jgi:hypothetical protein
VLPVSREQPPPGSSRGLRPSGRPPALPRRAARARPQARRLAVPLDLCRLPVPLDLRQVGRELTAVRTASRRLLGSRGLVTGRAVDRATSCWPGLARCWRHLPSLAVLRSVTPGTASTHSRTSSVVPAVGSSPDRDSRARSQARAHCPDKGRARACLDRAHNPAPAPRTPAVKPKPADPPQQPGGRRADTRPAGHTPPSLSTGAPGRWPTNRRRLPTELEGCPLGFSVGNPRAEGMPTEIGGWVLGWAWSAHRGHEEGNGGWGRQRAVGRCGGPGRPVGGVVVRTK